MGQETIKVEYPRWTDDDNEYPKVTYSQYPTLIVLNADFGEHDYPSIPVEQIKKDQPVIKVATRYLQDKVPNFIFMEYRTQDAVIRVRLHREGEPSERYYTIEYIFTDDPSKYSHFFTWNESLRCSERKYFPFMDKTFADIEKEILAGLDFIFPIKKKTKKGVA